MDLSTEHKILDLKNRIEASVVIWKRKMHDKEGKPSWASTVSLEKRELFEERAETILILIKQRFPGIPQSALEISKIQYNKVIRKHGLWDLSIFLENGHSIRSNRFLQDVGLSIQESYSRILESLAFMLISRIDDVLHADSLSKGPTAKFLKGRQSTPDMESESSMSLFDSIGLNCEMGHEKMPPELKADKKFSYTEHVGVIRSPTARHWGGTRTSQLCSW